MKVSDLSFRCPNCNYVTADLSAPLDPRVADPTIGDLPEPAMLAITCGRCGETAIARVGADSPAT